MEVRRLDIPVTRRDFTATRAAMLQDYAGLAVLFNTTAEAFLLLPGALRLLETIVTSYRVLSD